MYLTEDNRINTIMARVPVVGFVDIPNVTEDNICDVDYEMRNLVLKPNSIEEHSIYVEIEIGVIANVYEEKQINLIQDLYSPSENMEFNKKKITVLTNKKSTKETMQIREKVTLEGLENRSIIDVDVLPVIEKETKSQNRVVYEGELELRFVLADNDLQVDTRTAKIPFDYAISELEDVENINSNMAIEVANQDFIVQDGGVVNANLDLAVNADSYRNTNMSIIDEIQTNGEREIEDYTVLVYIVKKGDTLWKIAKRFGSTIEDIATVNGIEDENKLSIGQKLFIPRYKSPATVTYV